MVITSHGEGCFKIQTGGVSLVVDAPDNRLKPDIALMTRAVLPLSYADARPEDLKGPGEYDIKGVEIAGFPAGDSGKALETVYRVKAEAMTLVFLGNPSKLPDAAIGEKLGPVDILFAPPGSNKLVKHLSPKMAVAAYFKNHKEAEKEFGKVTGQDKLTIKQKELPQAMAVVILQ